jgi:hypothetical protein
MAISPFDFVQKQASPWYDNQKARQAVAVFSCDGWKKSIEDDEEISWRSKLDAVFLAR